MELESAREREKRMTILLFVPLIIIGVFFYNMSGRRMVVLCSGIIALVFYICMAINKYYGRFSSKELHWWFCVGTLIAGIVFLFTTISVLDKMKQP